MSGVSPIATEEERTAAIGAQWVPYAPGCATEQIEIKTFVETVKEEQVVQESGGPLPVSLSFVVP